MAHKTLTKVCILFSGDHRKHVVIQRKIASLQSWGYAVSVVDSSAIDDNASIAFPAYRHHVVTQTNTRLLVRTVWPIIRRVQQPRLSFGFWWSTLWLRTIFDALRMMRMALAERPDFYVAEDLQSAWGCLLAAQVHRQPVVYDAHELESEQGDPDPVRRHFLHSLEQKLIPRVDYLVVPNESRAAIYQERYSLRTAPIVIRNCPPFTEVPKSNKLRDVLGLPNSVHIVLYHGALIPYRALDNLIRSAAFFRDGIALVLIGEQGSYYHDVLEPLCHREPASNRIFCLPHMSPDEISSYVASADLGVVIYENVNLNNYLCAPLKLYEYVMMRVPVAMCEFPELRNFLGQYPVGVMFDPDDPLSIAQAVNNYFTGSGKHLSKPRWKMRDTALLGNMKA
jgi:glycosyltransferase involved in cell wall biosynthesis